MVDAQIYGDKVDALSLLLMEISGTDSALTAGSAGGILLKHYKGLKANRLSAP